MKISRVVMIIAVMLLLAPAYGYSAGLGLMRISLIEGDVQVKIGDAGDWGAASINGPLMEGDQIWVPQGGRVEMQLNGGAYIRLDQNSALHILSMDRDSSQFYLSQGHVYVYFNAPRGSVLQVDTPDASTRAFDGAVFRIDMSDEYRFTDVAVYDGYVETENTVGKTRIDAGQMLSIGQNTNGEIARMGAPDEWEGWNKSRNDGIFSRRGPSYAYLPPELRAYSYDFDTGGRWVMVPGYGYCWTPTTFVAADWAPYRLGRWVWIGGDYVWISHEPWGWAPYHYGRWVFIAGRGWCWVPPVARAVYWAPGYVGWVVTGDYVGWVPLAPGEVYYGRGYFGPNSVNITNVTINQVNVTNVYKNVYVNNSVTVVNRNTFATVSPRIVKVPQNVIQHQLFTKNTISAGAPAIRPAEGSSLMSARTVPSAKLPPQPIRNVQIPELKQSRPHIKDPNKSVMNPDAAVHSVPAVPVNRADTGRAPGRGIPKLQTVQPTPATPVSPGGPGGTVPPVPRREIRSLETRRPVPEGSPAPKEKKVPGKPEEKQGHPEREREKTQEFGR